MSGGLPYEEPDVAIDRFLTAIEDTLTRLLDTSEKPTWCVIFDTQNTIATPSASTDLVKITVDGELNEQIPADAANDDGNLQKPIFPHIGDYRHEPVHYTDTNGYSEQLAEHYLHVQPLADTVLPDPAVLDRICDRGPGRNLSDAFGHELSELTTRLTVKLADHTRTVLNSDTPVDVAISVDVFKRLLQPYQHQPCLLFDITNDPDDRISVPITYHTTATWVAPDTLPTAEKVYIHEHERAVIADHNYTIQDIRNRLHGHLHAYHQPLTVPDTTGRGIPATYGSIVQTDVDTSTGYFRVAPDADVSLVHTYWAALNVPDKPYLTHEISQETPEWFRDEFPSWSSAENGFVLEKRDGRRDIWQRLTVTGYWVVEGRNYRRKSDFRNDLNRIESLLEDELDCTINRHTFGDTKISKTPIHQHDVVDKLIENATGLPDSDTILTAASSPWQKSTDIDGINQPLFPRDLDKFVADTNILDAGTISQLVIDGPLYDSTVVIPDTVIHEIHRQVDEGRDIGEAGLTELETLHDLDQAGLITLDIADTSAEPTSQDNVDVDHTIINIARKRDIPICSDDETLLRIAQLLGVTSFQLKQELSQPKQLVEHILAKEGELPIFELGKLIGDRRSELVPTPNEVVNELFNSPTNQPVGDLSEEVKIRDLVNQLAHENKVYTVEDRVGLIKDICIRPDYDALTSEAATTAITDGRITESLAGPRSAYHTHIAIPQFLPQWAEINDKNQLEQELDRLSQLEQKQQIDIIWCEPTLDYEDVLTVDESYVKRALKTTSQSINVNQFDATLTLTIDTDSNPIIETQSELQGSK